MMKDHKNLPQRIETILRAATLAPSSHNTQPWLFDMMDSRIRLYADRSRALPVNDPDDRELAISCGCALMNLRIAAAREGYAVKVSQFDDLASSGLLAEIQLIQGTTPDPSDLSLFPAIQERRTYRKKFEDREAPDALLERLSAAAVKEGATFHVIRDEGRRERIAEFVAEGDALQWADPEWRRELAGWMRPRGKGEGLTVPGLMAPVIRTAIRAFDMSRGIAAKDATLAKEAPVIAVISTAHDDVKAHLNAGQALERVLLTACAGGLQASYLNQPIQAPSGRPQLQHLLESDKFPQILLRMGYPSAESPKPTPRRDLSATLAQSTKAPERVARRGDTPAP